MDKEFRKKLLDDPEQTIADSGLSLTPDEIKQVADAARKNAQRGNAKIDEQLGFEATQAGSWSS
jgi:hypothetical protein